MVSSQLVGCFGIGVNGSEVRKTRYSVQPFDETTERRLSLAVHAFQSRRDVFVSSMCDAPVDQDDRVRIGIPENFSGCAIPFVHDGRCEGVGVFCWCPDVVPTPPLSHSIHAILSVIASFLGLALVSWRSMEQIEKLSRQNESKDLFLSHIVRLGAEVQSADSQVDPDATVLSTIAEELANRFMCDTVEIYVLSASASPCPGDTHRLNAEPSAMPTFRRHCAYGIVNPSTEVVREIDRCPASTVLRSRHSCVWPNRGMRVVDEHMRNDGAFSDPDLRVMLQEYRAWMGVPLIIESRRGVVLYGVMTFGRFKSTSREDTFSHDEVALATTTAAMLSSSFHSKRLIAEERAALKNMMSLFRHDDMHCEFNQIGEVANGLMDISQYGGSRFAKAKDRIVVVAAELRQCVDMITLLVEGYDTFSRIIAGSPAFVGWTMLDSHIDDVLSTLKDYWTTRSMRGLGYRLSFVPPDSVALTGVRTMRGNLAYVISALIGNSEKSLLEAGRASPSIDVSVGLHRICSRVGFLRVSVRDNGKGLDANDPSAVARCFEKGVSDFVNENGERGTGLGLSIISEMLSSYWGEIAKKAMTVDGKRGVFACFTIDVPVEFDQADSPVEDLP